MKVEKVKEIIKELKKDRKYKKRQYLLKVNDHDPEFYIKTIKIQANLHLDIVRSDNKVQIFKIEDILFMGIDAGYPYEFIIYMK